MVFSGAVDNAGEWVYCGTKLPPSTGEWIKFNSESQSSNQLIRLTYYYQDATPLRMMGEIRVTYAFPVKATGQIIRFFPGLPSGAQKDPPVEIFTLNAPQELSWNPTTVVKSFEVRKRRTNRQVRWGIPIKEQGWAVTLEYLDLIRITPEIQGIIEEDDRLLNIGQAGNIHILLKETTP